MPGSFLILVPDSLRVILILLLSCSWFVTQKASQKALKHHGGWRVTTDDISEEKNLVDVNDLPGVSRRQADVSQLYLRAAQKGDASAALRTAVEHLQRNESEKASLELWKL